MKKDDVLRREIQRLLDQDRDLRSYHLEADVVEGQAQLHGAVDVLSEKKRAEELARSVKGVKDVDAAISIITDGPITDSDVDFEVAEELNAVPEIDPKRIGARSSKGVVTLMGRTDDPAEVEAAMKAAETARGVTAVRSEVKIGGEEDRNRLFHSQVRNDREKGQKGRPER
ncbi:MAG: BON domain-containing protein [Bacillota bacterium]